MKKCKRITLKRIQIVIVWLAFLAVFNFAALRIEYHLFAGEARENLASQAKNISVLLPNIEQNDRFVKQSIGRTMPARMNALAVGLDKYEDIESALLFLGGFMSDSGLESLVIYDAAGNVIYGDRAFAEELKLNSDDVDRYMTGEAKDTEDGRIGVATVGGRWLLVGKNKESSEQEAMEDYYSWKKSFEILTADQATSVTAISQEDGSILFTTIREWSDLGTEEADIRTQKGNPFADAGEMLDSLTASEQPELIRINGTSYYAAKISGAPDGVLLIATFPDRAVRDAVRHTVILLCLICFLVTGLYTAYAFFHISDQKESGEEKKQVRWNRGLATRLRTPCALAFIGMIGFSIYVGGLSQYSRANISNREMIEHALTLYDRNQDGVQVVRKWSDAEYLTRAEVAQCVIAGWNKTEMTKEALVNLTKAMDIQDISVFDREGVFQMAGYSRVQPNINEDSPFYALLEGESYVIGETEEDGRTGKTLRRIGVSMWSENGNPKGFVLITEDLDEPLKLSGITGYDYLFRQLSPPNGSRFVVAEAETKGVLYMGTVSENGYDEYSRGEDSQPDFNVWEIGLKEEMLQDSYDGSVNISNEKNVLSVRLKGENWIILMRQYPWQIMDLILRAIYTSMMALLYSLVVMAICCLGKNIGQTEGEADEAKEEAHDTESPRNETFSRVRHIFYKEKLFFEERWPNESKKWKEKTPAEKYRAMSRWLFLCFLVGVFIQILVEGENAILRTCTRSEWNSGFNLYSMTLILVTVCLLVSAKIFIHRVLYLSARAADPRGETICHLMDSFSGYILVIAGIFIGLYQLGLSATELSVTGGVVGLALSVGCQSIVTDMVAGILMTFEGVIRAGDMLFYEGNRYFIISVGIRTTTLRLYGKTTHVHNDDLKNIVTIPVKELVSVDASIRVDLSESVERVKEILEREMPVIHEKIVQIWEETDGPYNLGVDDITENWMEFSVYMMNYAEHFNEARRQLNEEVKKMCDRNHIQLAMSQIVVHEADE